jgi:dTDP-4-dehydrorhamnose reductase
MYLLLGSSGQLGRDLSSRLPGPVTCWTRSDVDLTHFELLRQKIAELKPELVINCAAYNFVDQAESEPDAAFAVNAWAVRQLAIVCRDLDVTLVQFSTDYVFGLDASRRTAFEETDGPGPISVYGMSKLTGEYLVRSICPRHFVIRTCGLYGIWGTGGKGGNFVETLIRNANQAKPLRVVNDQYCTPSFTVDVAETTAKLIQTKEYGLYHLTNDGSCNWFELTEEIFRILKMSPDLTSIPTSGFPRPARRPPYSVLSLKKLESIGISKPRHWKEALRDYLIQRKERHPT